MTFTAAPVLPFVFAHEGTAPGIERVVRPDPPEATRPHRRVRPRPPGAVVGTPRVGPTGPVGPHLSLAGNGRYVGGHGSATEDRGPLHPALSGPSRYPRGRRPPAPSHRPESDAATSTGRRRPPRWDRRGTAADPSGRVGGPVRPRGVRGVGRAWSPVPRRRGGRGRRLFTTGWAIGSAGRRAGRVGRPTAPAAVDVPAPTPRRRRAGTPPSGDRQGFGAANGGPHRRP